MVAFILKAGAAGLFDDAGPTPPDIVHVQIAPQHVPGLRSQAKLILQTVRPSLAGDSERAERFIAAVVADNTCNERDIKEMLAAVLVFLSTDTQDRLSAVIDGTVTRVGFVMTADRRPDIAVALKRLRMPVGGNIAAATVPEVRRFRFRYFAH